MLTCPSEPCILTRRDRKPMNIFERKVYRRILGPVYGNEKENWRTLYSKEVYAVVKKPTITETIGLNRLCWFGHVQRMGENRIPKSVLYMIWEQHDWEVDQEIDGKMEWGSSGRIVGWEGQQEKVHNREEWKKLLRTAGNRCILHMPMEWMNSCCYVSWK